MRLTTTDSLTARIVRKFLVTREPDIIDVIEWCKEALRQIDVYEQFEKKMATIEIEEYSGRLPMDFYAVDGNELFHAMQIRGDRVYIDSTKNGTFTLPYLAFPTDQLGALLIPDNEEVLDALMWYIVENLCYLKIIIPNSEVNSAKAHQMWLQKKIEGRADMRLGDIQGMQKMVNNQRSMRFNVNPLYLRGRGIRKR